MNIVFLCSVSVYNPRNTFFLNIARILHAHGHTILLIHPPVGVESQWRRYVNARTMYIRTPSSIEIVLRNEAIDRVVVWNGTHESDITQACERAGIPVWYMENGYVPNTLQCMTRGVNARASLATLSKEELMQFRFPSTPLKRKEYEVKKTKDFHPFRYAWTRVFQPLSTLQTIAHMLYRVFVAVRFQKSQDTHINDDAIGSFAFFPLQVNDDTQITHNSSFRDMKEVLNMLLVHMKKAHMSLIVKEHPKETQYVRYDEYHNPPHVYVTKRASLEGLITASEFVITVNSSVGFQALECGKKVLLLGDAFYARIPGVVSCRAHEDIASCIDDIKNLKPDWEQTREIMHVFKEHVFIPGNWRNPDTELLYRICERVLA